MSLYKELIDAASFYVGVAEQVGRPNAGPNIEEFQKAVDGKAVGEPWCAAFVAFCIKQVGGKAKKDSPLYLSEHVMTTWHKNPDLQRSYPLPGFLVVWRHGDGPSGHIGIVESVDAGKTGTVLHTIEGNTGPDDKAVVREGDGVFRKTRTGRGSGNMRVVGYLDPWGEIV